MTLGFSIASEVAADDTSAAVETLATMALEADAVNLDRVLAFYAARYLMRDLQASPEDLAAFANWLTKGERTGDEGEDEEGADEDEDEDVEEEEDDARCTVRMWDWWPPVLVVAFAYVVGLLIGHSGA